MNSNNALSVWNNGFGPLGDLRREMSRLIDDFWATAPDVSNWRNADVEWHPACDVEESEGHFLLTLDMPGIPRDQIKLEVIDNQVLISGERRQEQKKTADGTWYSERRYGKFHRSFALPAGVDAEKVEASYQDGTLRVYIPKSDSAKPRQVKIGSGASTGFFGRLIGQSSTKETEERHPSNDHEKNRVAS